MRDEMNSYRFEISNRCENKFCSHKVSFRLHFKTTRYFDGHVQTFNFGQCLRDTLSPEMKFHLCQNDRYESIPALSFKRTCILNATSSEYALIHFVWGKSCSHENLMLVQFHFTSIHVNTSKKLTEHRREIFNRNEISYRFEFISLLL